MATLTAETSVVLDPRAEDADELRGNGPDVGSLRGKTIGLKTDEFWFAWDWVAEEWAAALRADGADVVIWRERMPQGVATPLSVADFDAFTGQVDAVVTARVLSEEGGWSDIRMAILPYPLEGKPEDEVRQIARTAYPSLLASMGAVV